MSQLWRVASWSAAALAAAVLVAEPAAAQSGSPLQENMPRSWFRNYDYGVELDGKSMPDAGLFQVPGRPLMLIYGPSLDTGYVLSFEPKVVRPVGRDRITPKNDLEVVLAESSFAGAAPLPWMQDGPAAVVFYAGPRRFKIARVEPIIGTTSVEEIFQKNPMYRRGMEEYRPDLDAVSALKRVGSPVSIEVWFGSWCPHCQQVVPRFIKAIQATGNPNLAVSYHGVPREFGAYKPATDKDIKALPTFIIFKGGREIARIRGGPASGTLEAELLKLLNGQASAAGY